MSITRLRWIAGPTLAGAALWALTLPSAWAVPSYARQTSMACSTCHTVFPELTPFGREFKLNGYVLDNMKQIKGITVERSETLSLNTIPPLSMMAQIAYTHTSTALPDAAAAVQPALSQNGDLNFPQQVSLFYAGKIAEGLGAFIQLTYDGVGDHFGMDNTDIRYAMHTSLDAASQRDVIFGLTLNNNPTVQDPWNSTQAWGFPYSGSAVAPGPNSSAQIDTGGVGQNAAGLGAYMWYDHSLYAELSLYTGSKVGGTHPFDSTQTPLIHGVAPYWRLAWEQRWDRNSLSVGTYGIRAGIVPASLPATGPTDKFTDYALDTQYQYIGEDHLATVLGTFIHEKQSLDASFPAGLSANASNTLTTFKLGGEYYYKRKFGGSIGFFNTTGSTDSVLYPALDGSGNPIPVTGSASSSPANRGYVLEANYLPFLNVKLQLQYTIYSKFNGGSGNYDGAGRSASDNNTLYLLAWFNF